MTAAKVFAGLLHAWNYACMWRVVDHDDAPPSKELRVRITYGENKEDGERESTTRLIGKLVQLETITVWQACFTTPLERSLSSCLGAKYLS